MLTARENFLETIHGGHPDRFVKQYEATPILRGDPVGAYTQGKKAPGMEPINDAWGTRIIWPAGEPGAIPDPNVRMIDDIDNWRECLTVPDLSNCASDELWAPYLAEKEKFDRNEHLLTVISTVGVFERMHYLMGFEDALCNIMTDPEEMKEIAQIISDVRLKEFEMLVDRVHPDVVLSHDDWGTKINVFMRPDIWRDIIKPAYEKPYQFLHDEGVIIIHHSDSFCEPLVEDMVDLHIDVWQGVLPQNDIPKLQKQLNGRMALQGGIDVTVVDRDDSTEEEIRKETRRVCETYAVNGFFIPSVTYGGPGFIHPGVDAIVNDEIDKCSREFFG